MKKDNNSKGIHNWTVLSVFLDKKYSSQKLVCGGRGGVGRVFPNCTRNSLVYNLEELVSIVITYLKINTVAAVAINLRLF